MSRQLVMIVDDDDEIRSALEDVLEGEGYAVVGARDGQQALTYLRHGKRPSAILLDLWMPVMDGWQLRDELLKDETLAKIPVIVLTAARDQRAAALHVTEILTKPVELGRLLDVLGGATAASH